MRRFDNEGIGQQWLEALRITPPENRHQRLGLAIGVRARVQRTNRGLGDFLPAFA